MPKKTILKSAFKRKYDWVSLFTVMLLGHNLKNL